MEVIKAAKSSAITVNTTHSDVNESKSHAQRARPSLVRAVLTLRARRHFGRTAGGREGVKKERKHVVSGRGDVPLTSRW